MEGTMDLEQTFEAWRKKGDPALLAALFDETAPDLLALACRLVGRVDLAEEVVQETYLALIRGAAGWEAERPLLPWMTGILANQAGTVLRRLYRRPDPERLPHRPPVPPPEEVARAEAGGMIRRALGAMPKPYREVLYLHLLEGKKAAGVAHLLDRPTSTVRTQIQRGLELLRRGLPAGLAPAVTGVPLAGLPALREKVLQEATRATGAAGTAASGSSLPILIGGAMMKKLWIGVAATALLTLGITLSLTGEGVSPTPPAGAADTLAATPATSPEGPATPPAPRRRAPVGRVLTCCRPGGEPLAEVALHWLGENRILGEGRTDRQGRIRLTAAAAVHALVEPAGRVPALFALDPRVERLVVPPGRTVAGLYTVDGKPPEAAATIRLLCEDRDRPDLALSPVLRAALAHRGVRFDEFELPLDRRGRFRLGGLQARWLGRLRIPAGAILVASGPGQWRSDDRTVVLLEPRRDCHLQAMRLPILQGRAVTAKGGAPLPGLALLARVTMGDDTRAGGLLTTAAGGSFRLVLKPVGGPPLEIWGGTPPAVRQVDLYERGPVILGPAGGRETRRRLPRLPFTRRGHRVDLGEVPFGGGGTLAVRVADGAGRPLAGAQVLASGGGGRHRRGSTDDRGRCTLVRLEEGPATLTVTAPGHLPVGREVQVGRDRNLDLVLAPALDLVVELATGRPHSRAAGFLVTVAAGEDLLDPRLDPGREKAGELPPLRTDGEGRVRFSALRPGLALTLTVHSPWREKVCERIHLLPSRRRVDRLRIDLPALADPVRGRVVDGLDRPLTGAKLRLEQGGFTMERITGKEGRFAFPLSRGGWEDATLTATHAACGRRRLTDPGRAGELLIRLHRGRDLRITAIDTGGNPVRPDFLSVTVGGEVVDGAELQLDGSWVLHNLPLGKGVLEAVYGQATHHLPLRASQEEILVRLPAAGILACRFTGLPHPGRGLLFLVGRGPGPDLRLRRLVEVDGEKPRLAPLLLMPGRWHLHLERRVVRPGRGPRVTPLTGERVVAIRPGARTEVTLRPGAGAGDR